MANNESGPEYAEAFEVIAQNADQGGGKTPENDIRTAQLFTELENRGHTRNAAAKIVGKAATDHATMKRELKEL